ncbi:MAG TPA: hypothetical protein VMS93_10430 [Candidatus Saccharimonadales bacterium]|nr:hypothetical protein [Candidatus Saccharimonadales bacterium]
MAAALLVTHSLFHRNYRREPPGKLQVQVRFTGRSFFITNLDRTTWNGIRIVIHAGKDAETYSTSLDSLSSNSTATIPARDLTNYIHGVPLDPSRDRLWDFLIETASPNRRFLWSGPWGEFPERDTLRK